MSSAKLATGTLLQLGDAGTPEAFTAIAEIASLEAPELSRNEIDVSTHNVGEEEILAGMLRKGKINLTINYLPGNTTHNVAAGLLKFIKDNTKRNYRFVWPTAAGGGLWSFAAYVTNFKPLGGLDVARQAQVSLRIAGAITLTDAASATITSSSVANPSVITTEAAHGFTTGQTVTIAGHSGSTPDINGNHVVTVTGTTTFTIPVNVTVGGTGGTATLVS